MRSIFSELFSRMAERRAKAHQVTKTAAMNDLRCGGGSPPTWLRHPDRLDEFLSGVNALSSRRNVPHAYVLHVLENEENYRRLVNYAGALEVHKATFAAQQLAIADLILEWWYSHLRAETIKSEISRD